LSQAQQAVAPIGVFGGSYNPIHIGHLRSALELVEKLGLEQLRLMPCAVPPLRDEPECSASDRAAMVELALSDEPRLVCDTRELKRSGKSFTIDSLAELRAEVGDARSLCMVVGCDAVLQINRWHRWQELLELAHIVVIARPGWTLPEEGEVANWLRQNAMQEGQSIAAAPAGRIVIEELRPLPISSTEIRELLRAGRSPRYLVPQGVLDYIATHNLYH
jgi:nicotinate-nucleotide adenylyltransferase